MFGRKKKKAPFGAGLEQDCGYCRFGGGNGETPCALGLEPGTGKCKKYQYDPLKREPRTAPPLREYDAEDFQL